jgi:hypothetical protein
VVGEGNTLGFHNTTGAPTPELTAAAGAGGVLSVLGDGEVVATAFSTHLAKLTQSFSKGLFVGAVDSGTGDPAFGLRGAVAEIRLWGTPRTPDQIAGLLGRRALTGKEEEVLAWWRIDEGAGHVLHDCRCGAGFVGRGVRVGPDGRLVGTAGSRRGART